MRSGAFDGLGVGVYGGAMTTSEKAWLCEDCEADLGAEKQRPLNQITNTDCEECSEPHNLYLCVLRPQVQETTKPTNPKDAIGSRKAGISNVPAQVVAELGLAMLEGAAKYGRHNYRVAGVRASVYYDAAMRHLMAWWEGEDIDPDSGLPHVVKAMACLAVMRDAQINNKLSDDRPPLPRQGWVAELNKKAEEILARYPEPKRAFTKDNKGE